MWMEMGREPVRSNQRDLQDPASSFNRGAQGGVDSLGLLWLDQVDEVQSGELLRRPAGHHRGGCVAFDDVQGARVEENDAFRGAPEQCLV